ncbi:hypothetical protein SARC_01574 [Sphaeroforma arctica JP610]|uniref:LNR domain-containing protein n=1 Tax=Sphaeroforma arctica JP610 TaxID=667725 RepID=A0A0L0GB55_9EUKA|nr:hypothetical protein SARC_01574 [Sphaeroforma arctica JP610]KNC86252.1 hypothetical protein SARC_01574 [Sphaeroforma arctica JP610]|eukprot:XP_014160154.1 hypothetical protein SARC_01574 [Sphaeroforma arctica JP610]
MKVLSIALFLLPVLMVVAVDPKNTTVNPNSDIKTIVPPGRVMPRGEWNGVDTCWFFEIKCCEESVCDYKVKNSNGICDSECNTMECNYDGGDCIDNYVAPITDWEKNHLRRTLDRFLLVVAAKDWDVAPGIYKDEYKVITGDDDECLVLFEGTDSMDEALSVLDTQLIAAYDGKDYVGTAATGWVAFYYSVIDDIKKQISLYCKDRAVVTFAGHSRGGATAALAASAWYQSGKSEYTRLITFGALRTFAIEDANWAHGQFYQLRVVNNNDACTGAVGVDTSDHSRLYKHYGTVICIGCTGSDQDFAFGGGFARCLDSIYIAKTHSMDTYSKELKRYLGV